MWKSDVDVEQMADLVTDAGMLSALQAAPVNAEYLLPVSILEI